MIVSLNSLILGWRICEIDDEIKFLPFSTWDPRVKPWFYDVFSSVKHKKNVQNIEVKKQIKGGETSLVSTL